MIETRIIKQGEEPEFLEIPAFMGTKNGWFVNTPTLFGIAHVPAKKGPETLGEVKSAFLMNERRLPEWLIKKAHDFFRKVWDKQHTEAMVYIVHHHEKDEFGLWVPEQYVSGAAVNYRLQPGQIKGGWHSVGTIHSHCNFGAFHSGTDQHDMDGMPGLHITIGHVDRDTPEFAVALSANGQRFDVESIEEIIDRNAPKDAKGYDSAPAWWLTLAKTGTAPWKGTQVKYNKGPAKKTSFTYSKDKWSGPTTLQHQWDTAAWGWDDDDDDWAMPQKQQIEFKDLVDGNVEDPFRLFEEEIYLSKKVLDEEVEQMAYLGFSVQYSITWNPKAAVAWLEKLGMADEFIDPQEWTD